ncbi:MAG: hypothetical protein MZV63_30570 [Marinilabiliales bacterium]|nr:hypothetical protein [Marinilabiliales bacterium]
MDEFQEIFRISSGLDRFLRSVMQNHKNLNYVFMGSSESMIREIFEKRVSFLPIRIIDGSGQNFSG